jgi:hypothetical protein
MTYMLPNTGSVTTLFVFVLTPGGGDVFERAARLCLRKDRQTALERSR